jgi:hypothetical protein
MPAENLLSAGRAAAHRAVGIRLALNAAIESDHGQRKCQAFRMIFRQGRNLIDEVLPVLATRVANKRNGLMGKEQMIVYVHTTIYSITYEFVPAAFPE